MNRLLFLSSKAVFVVFYLLLSNAVFAQQDFYYSRGEKIRLTVSEQKISIKFKKSDAEAAIENLRLSEPALGKLNAIRLAAARNFFTIQLNNPGDVKQLVNRLKQKPEVEMVNAVYVAGGIEGIPFDHFVVQFKSSVTTGDIEVLNSRHHVEVVSISTAAKNLYTLRVTSASDLSVLAMAKLYYERLPCEWAAPDFVVPIKLSSIPNDPFYQNQYYLHNTGQSGGVTDADIDAPEAWDITTGSSSITVAVIDVGVTAHEDLPANRMVSGYDYLDGDSDPSPVGNAAHGMACAGIVAATQNNNLGISGVAPNCTIMPLRIFGEKNRFATINNVAAAIDFAWQNGADVLSNSWVYDTSDPNPPMHEPVKDAINRALTLGRNGKGCVVVFGAGNSADRSNGNLGDVQFPANIPGVLAVGAIDKSNNIQNYSPQDAELDVVAPSGQTSVCTIDEATGQQTCFRNGDVWSTDIAGQPGYNPGNFGIGPPNFYVEYTWNPPGGDAYPPGDYTAKFAGTSAACPQVAGIAALILSVDSNLEAKPTNPEVQDIIKRTADSLGTTRFDEDYGYGRVNAHAAVLEADDPITNITNPPPAPTGFVVTNPNSINQKPNLAWNASPDADCYYIYRRVSFYPNWIYIGASTTTSYTDDTFTILDSSDPMAEEFYYHVRAVNSGGESPQSNTDSVYGLSFHKKNDKSRIDSPESYALQHNYPNPFNPVTEIQYALPEEGFVDLKITNLLGQVVRTLVSEKQTSGTYNKTWNGRDNRGVSVASGIYLYRISVRSEDGKSKFIAVRKMSLVR